MAECTKKTIAYTLEMNQDEAQILRDILAHVALSGPNGLHGRKIADALCSQGVEFRDNILKGDLSFR